MDGFYPFEDLASPLKAGGKATSPGQDESETSVSETNVSEVEVLEEGSGV